MVEPQARNDKHHKHMFVYVPVGAENDACAVVNQKRRDAKSPALVGNGLVIDLKIEETHTR